jgi:hypothetical protein
MSARFFKIFSGVFAAHLVVLSVVWVGFSAPAPRPPATFTYEGALPVGDTGSRAEGGAFDREGTGPLTSDQVAFDHLDSSSFNHWIKLRDLSKP